VSNASGQVTISWAAGPTAPASVYGAAATGFRIYASTDGYGFDGGTLVNGGGTTSATLSGYDPDIPYYFRVVAVNAGGESKPSEVMAVLPSGGSKQVLIVNGFDRFDRTEDFRYAYLGGAVDRVWPRYNNSFDYVVQVESAIQSAQPGVHVASTSNEAVISGAVKLTDYDSVVWILGEESTADDTFNATEQTKVEQFIAAGGNLFVTGAEIGWDLDAQNNGRSFYETTLKGNYVADDAGTYKAVPAAGGIFAGLSTLTFSNGAQFSSLDSQTYNVDYPDVISPQSGAQLALNYSGGAGGGAGIQVTGTGGRGNIVMFGFPFETITTANNRKAVMGRVLDFFSVAPPAPAVEIKTQVNGQDADAAPGVVVAAGNFATFTYTVTNPGSVPLSGVAVKDNNGTPGNSADDQTPNFSGGDANGNAQLDPGEVWTYTLTRIAPPGQASYLGSVSAFGNGEGLSDSDVANMFGSAPAIVLQVSVNGEDANLPPGPTVTIGDLVSFSYLLSNTGNTPVLQVILVDTNGTPGNAADDVHPAYVSGDRNNNGELDLGEIWQYASTRPALPGQYNATATAVGADSLSQGCIGIDTVNYVGVLPANADFDADGLVDGADFLTWQRGFGATGAGLSDGDANGDGTVDEADLIAWANQFQQPPGEMASVQGSALASALSAEPVQEIELGADADRLFWLAQWRAPMSPVHDVSGGLSKRESELALSMETSSLGVATHFSFLSRRAEATEEMATAHYLQGRSPHAPTSAIDAACELTSDWSWREALG
jgi:hypothetical protein